MGFNRLKFADLFWRDIVINGAMEFKEFLFQVFINKGLKIKGSICGIFRKFIQHRQSRFVEGVRDNGSQPDIGNYETVLQTVLFT